MSAVLTICVRVFVEVQDAIDAQRAAQRLSALLGRYGEVVPSPVQKYWKIPECYELRMRLESDENSEDLLSIVTQNLGSGWSTDGTTWGSRRPRPCLRRGLEFDASQADSFGISRAELGLDRIDAVGGLTASAASDRTLGSGSSAATPAQVQTGGRFELRLGGEPDEVAYLRLPSYPASGQFKTSKTLRLHDVIGAYDGPDVYLDIDESGTLVGIDVLV